MGKLRRVEPLRYQVRSQILDLIIQDNYQPGDKLPTEQELIERLDVSRSTLRESLHLLEEERLIRTKRGSGRFLLATPKDFKFDITRLQSVTEMLADYGIQVTTRVVAVREQLADAEIRSYLGLQDGDRVIWIERVRFAGIIPVIYSIDIIPRDLLTGPWHASQFEGSLLALLKKNWGLIIDHSYATLRVVLTEDFAPPEVIAAPSVPWFLFEQVNFSSEGKPIIYSKDYHRGDAITFHVIRHRFQFT